MIELQINRERLRRLAPLHQDTILVGPDSQAAIVAPAEGEFQEIAREAAAELTRRTGRELSILDEKTFINAEALPGHLVALGHAGNNQLLRRLHYLEYLGNGDYPTEGHRVISVHNPCGDSSNVLAALGYNPATARRSVQQLLDRIVQRDDCWLTRGRLHLVDPIPVTPDPAELLERVAKLDRTTTGRPGIFLQALGHLRTGGEERWARAFITAVTPFATGAIPLSFWLMSAVDFWTDHLATGWDAVEEFDYFTDEERLLVANFVASCAQYCHDSITYQKWRILPEEHQIFNHHTFPATGLFFSTMYLRRHGYEIDDLDAWLLKAMQVFARAAQAGRSFDEGGAGYSWLVGNHLLRVSFAVGDTSYARGDKLVHYADLAAVIQNNHFEVVPFGDCGAYHTTGTGAAQILLRAAEWRQDPGYKWLAEQHAPTVAEADVLAREVPATPPEKHRGLFVLPLDPVIYRWAGLPRFPNYPLPAYPPNVPAEKGFDKLSLRGAWEPEADYLLLQGFGDGQHGHPDANAISQYQARGRLFLVDNDYIRRMPKQHNMVMVIREGEHGPIPVTARLNGSVEFSGGAMTQTALVDYNGCDWTRTIIWLSGDCVLVVDALQAKVEADYELRCYWRTLGEAELTEGGMHAEQQGKHFHVIELTDSARRLDIEPMPVNSTKYPEYHFGDSKPKVLAESRRVHLAVGEETCFINLLLPNGGEAVARRRISWGDEGHVLVAGQGPALTVNVNGFQVAERGGYAFAPQERLTALTATSQPVAAPGVPPLTLKATGAASCAAGPVAAILPGGSVEQLAETALPAPATCLSPAPAGGVLVGCEDGSILQVADGGQTKLVGKAADRVGAVLAGCLYGEEEPTLMAACYDFTLRLFSAAGAERLTVALPASSHMPAWGKALCLADLDGDGKLWPIVGTASWRVHAVSPEGDLRWTFDTAAHAVNRVAAGDLNGDGRDEIAVATVYFCVPAITADGGRLWEDEDYNDYWTAGPIFSHLEIADIDGDGQLEVLTAASDALVHCIDHQGVKKWTRSVGDDPRGLVITAAGLAAASATGDLHFLDGQGRRLHRLSLGSPCLALTRTGANLCVTTEDRRAVWVAEDGSPLAGHQLPAAAGLSLGCADGRVWLATEDAALHCLRL